MHGRKNDEQKQALARCKRNHLSTEEGPTHHPRGGRVQQEEEGEMRFRCVGVREKPCLGASILPLKCQASLGCKWNIEGCQEGSASSTTARCLGKREKVPRRH